MSGEQDPQNIEAQQLQIEYKKLELEERKLDLEKWKARWTIFSIAVPLLAVLGTIIYGLFSTAQQARITFQLEAAKEVMQSTSYGDAVSKAILFKEVFPDRLPPKFMDRLSLKEFPDAPNVSAKWNFLQVISARGLRPDQTAKLYRVLFPDDDHWSNSPGVNDVLAKSSAEDDRHQN
jgi:hypothetical protein